MTTGRRLDGQDRTPVGITDDRVGCWIVPGFSMIRFVASTPGRISASTGCCGVIA
jgi:hypothetical protein